MDKFKAFTLLTLIFCSTSIAFAKEIKTFNNITVNPRGNLDYKAVVTVHIVASSEMNDAEEYLATREAIVTALNSVQTLEYNSDNVVPIVKDRILSYLKETELVGGNKVENVYITDLLVSFTGSARMFIREARPAN